MQSTNILNTETGTAIKDQSKKETEHNTAHEIRDEIRNKKILLVDDEKELLKMTETALRDGGFFQIYTAESCAGAVSVLQTQQVALILLDVMLPDGNGFSFYEELRRHTQAPILFLTAKGEPEDRIHGLGLGADDYIVKPFLMKELLLRIEAVLRRTYQIKTAEPCFYLGSAYISFETASVWLNGKETPFTAKELLLLKKLYENKNRIVTSDALCMAAWGDGYYGYENTLAVHIRRLREKIEVCPSKPKYIITAKGIGYRLLTDKAKGDRNE